MPAARRKSLILLHAAVMLFGLSGVLGRGVSVSAVGVAWGRVVCSSCLLGLFLLIRRESLRLFSRRDGVWFVLAGAILALHWTAFFQSVQLASVAVGTITFSTYPLFLTALEPLVYREPFRRADLLSSVLLLAGVAITVPAWSFSSQATIGLLWGMVGSFTYAVLTLFNRYFAARYSGVRTSFYEQAVAAAVLTPAALALWTAPSPGDVAAVGAIGVLCTALAFSLFVTAQRSVRAQTAGIVSGMETIYGIVFAWWFLGEPPTVRELLGGAVILSVAMAASWRSARPELHRCERSE